MTWAIGYFLYPYLVEEDGSDLADFFMVPVALGILVLCLALARLSRRTRRAPPLEAVIARGLLYRTLSQRALQKQQSFGNKMRKPASAPSSSSRTEGRKTPMNGDGGNGLGESPSAGRRARPIATKA